MKVIIYIYISNLCAVINSESLKHFEDIKALVVKGLPISIEEVPFMTHLKIKCKVNNTSVSYECGASIYSSRVLLTAAHCLEDLEDSCIIFVSVGNTGMDTTLTHKADSYKIHNEYSTEGINNDIALIKLDKKLNYSKCVKNVKIPNKTHNVRRAVVAGWGLISENGTRGNTLKAAKQMVWTRKKCIKAINKTIPIGTICGKSKENNTKYVKYGYPYRGDSGGALVVKWGGKYIQIGIVSYRKSSHPTIHIYTDVSYFYNWIKSESKRLLQSFNFGQQMLSNISPKDCLLA